MRRGAGLALLGLLLAACGSLIPNEAAPTYTVQGGENALTLPAWTFCTKTMCADGMPPDPPAGVGRPDQVRVGFSERGWTLTAEFSPVGADCGRAYDLPLTRDGSDWVLDPAGPAGTYDVTLSAHGNPHGDAVATFRWTTPVRGVLPPPEAGLLTDHLELHVRNLATTPQQGRLTVTVTSATGQVSTVRPEHARPEEESGTCRPEGRIDFSPPGIEAPDLGPYPRRYDVRLELDGRSYTAAATAPDGAPGVDGHPTAYLTFDPPLPAFTG